MQTNNTDPETVGAWIGLDWARDTHVWDLFSADGRRTAGSLANDPEIVMAWIARVAEEIPEGVIRVLLETKTEPIAHWLAAHPRVEVYVVHPLAFKNYRLMERSSGAKDDPSDAALLNEFLRKHFKKVHRVRVGTGEYAGLAKMVADRRKLVDTRSGTIAQLREELGLSLPQCLKWFDDFATPAIARFLGRWPSLEALQKASGRTLSRVLREDFHWTEERIGEWRGQLKQCHSAISDESLVRASALHIAALARLLESLGASVTNYDKQIHAIAREQEDYSLFAALPGAGNALTPRLMVAFGTDRQAWKEAKNLQCYAGVAPVT